MRPVVLLCVTVAVLASGGHTADLTRLRGFFRCDPVCAVWCPNGNVLDSRGCPTCRCKPLEIMRKKRSVADLTVSPLRPPRCPRYRCHPDLECKFGLAKTADGCPTCRCRDPVCPRRICRNLCISGYKKDARGCDTCTCKPFQIPLCPMIACQISMCPNGFVYDKNGCNTCRCKPSHCKMPRCMRFCPNGFEKDSNGCQTCSCRTVRCPKCPRFCIPHGTDKNGCKKCKCILRDLRPFPERFPLDKPLDIGDKILTQ